ncbi:unnamed protein product, partial [Laminaria digitata]
LGHGARQGLSPHDAHHELGGRRTKVGAQIAWLDLGQRLALVVPPNPLGARGQSGALQLNERHSRDRQAGRQRPLGCGVGGEGGPQGAPKRRAWPVHELGLESGDLIRLDADQPPLRRVGGVA